MKICWCQQTSVLAECEALVPSRSMILLNVAGPPWKLSGLLPAKIPTFVMIALVVEGGSCALQVSGPQSGVPQQLAPSTTAWEDPYQPTGESAAQSFLMQLHASNDSSRIPCIHLFVMCSMIWPNNPLSRPHSWPHHRLGTAGIRPFATTSIFLHRPQTTPCRQPPRGDDPSRKSRFDDDAILPVSAAREGPRRT